MQNPFEISELRWLIAHFLKGRDLKACALVCKAWHWDFQPFIWHVLKEPKTTRPEHLAAWREGVQKNIHWIKCIDKAYAHGTLAMVEDQLLAHCRSLVSIEIPFKANTNTWISLVKLNPGLQRLDAPWLDMRACDRLAAALEGHYDLHYLRQFQSFMPALLQILVACPSLRKLDVGYMRRQIEPQGEQAHDEKDAKTPTRTFGVRNLKISLKSNQSMVEKLLSHLPEIESLELDPVSGLDVERNLDELDLVKLFREGCLPRVTELITYAGDNFPELMMIIPPGQLWSVNIKLESGAMLLQLLEYQGANLQALCLRYSGDCSVLSEIFYQCTRLKRVEIAAYSYYSFLDVKDLLYKPWVCMALEVLRAPIGVHSGVRDGPFPPELEDAVAANRAQDDPMPEWRVAEALFLDRMNKLRNLREVDFAGFDQSRALSYETRTALKCKNLCRELPDVEEILNE